MPESLNRKEKNISFISLNLRNLRAFTLVELLLVIFIIGLLVGASATVAINYRNRAKDGRIEATLSQIRKEATLILNESGNFDSTGNELCDSINTINDGNVNHPDLKVIEDEVKKFNGNQDVKCYASSDSFCVQSPLVTSGFYCVDSTGYAGGTANCTPVHISCQ
jgi:prepilin-type N-terminal cleavage/methylation domain-containing protein